MTDTKLHKIRRLMKQTALMMMAAVLALSSHAGTKGEFQERVDSMEDVTIGLLRDGAYVATIPFRPTKKGLLITAGALSLTGVLMGYDRKISNSVQHSRDRTLKKFLKDLDEDQGIEHFGRSSGVMLTAASFYAGGILTDSPRAKRVAFIAVESWIYNDTITKLLKAAIGRARPGGRDPYVFDSFSGKSSMPSGHTTTAFTLASVIASEYDSKLVDIASYGTAGLVGFSRLYRDVHWASDVLISAFLGIAVGKATYRIYGKNPRDWKIIYDGETVRLAKKF